MAVGHVAPGEIEQMLALIEKARFFEPPLRRGFAQTDGPGQTLYARRGKAERLLQHDGYGNEGYRREFQERKFRTSRDDHELKFLAMWDDVMAAINAIKPSGVKPYEGGRALEPSKVAEPTDMQGDPYTDFCGVMEKAEWREYMDDGTFYVAVTPVRT